ncbi:MAG: amino acid permease, partial [Proteobacteria bacterium]
LYPVLPLVFVAMCAYLLYSSITYAQSQNAGWVAIGVVLSGVVAWLFMLLGGGGERRA